jgi:hypothetical protein
MFGRTFKMKRSEVLSSRTKIKRDVSILNQYIATIKKEQDEDHDEMTVPRAQHSLK